MLKSKKTVGIIGGMGPLATADLFSKIIQDTAASCDQEHLHILIDNNTLIPDRTKAILGEGENPIPELSVSARRLQAAGADFLIMPCNTAHYFHADVSRACTIPVLNMLEETATYLSERGIKKVGLLATDGTIRSGVYARAMEEKGIEMIVPEGEQQAEVMGIIYRGVKAGNMEYDAGAFRGVCEDLLRRGAETLVLGCTELPLAFSLYRIELPATDPTKVLADAAILFAGAELKV